MCDYKCSYYFNGWVSNSEMKIKQSIVSLRRGLKMKILFFILMLVSFTFGCSNSSSNDYRKGHLMTVESCKQKSAPGFQNSGAYYMIVKGVPQEEFCSSFVNHTQALDSDVGKTCKDWKESKCNFSGMKK